MKQEYNIYSGLGGGFGGARYFSTILAKDIEEATIYARDMAVQDYEMYEGLHGILNYDEVAEELGMDANNLSKKEKLEVDIAYQEEVESWIEYYAVLTSEDDEVEEDELVREHDIC